MVELSGLLELVDKHARTSEQYRAARKLYGKKLAPSFSPIYDFFEVDELRISKILAWMLNPKASHAQGDVFLQAFLTRFVGWNDGNLNTGEASVQLEVATDSQDRSGRKIDILVRFGRKAAIAIENKPFAAWQQDQCACYMKHALSCVSNGGEVALLAFIGWAEDPQEELERHVGAALGQGGSYKGFGYEALKLWLGDCSALSGAPSVTAFLTHFEDYLQRRFGGTADGAEMKEQVDTILSTPERTQATLQLFDSRPQVLKEISDRFAAELTRQLPASCRILENSLPRLRKHDHLVIDVNSNDLDFEIYADAANLESLSFGLAFKKDQTKKGRSRFVDLHAAILKEDFAESDDNANESWLWWEEASTLLEPGLAASLSEKSRVIYSLTDPSRAGLPAAFSRVVGRVRQLIETHPPSPLSTK